MHKVKTYSEFINENLSDPIFVRIGDSGSRVLTLQTALEKLGFPLQKYGTDSKFGPETFGAAQKTIQTIAQLTNLAQIVQDPDVAKFNPSGLTELQYNIIAIVGQNEQMIGQLKQSMQSFGPVAPPQVAPAPSTGVPSGSGTAQQAYNFFVSKGYTPVAAAGITANIKTESDFKPTATGDHGLAKSLAQWHPDRYNWLAKKYDLTTVPGALAAIDYELRNSEIQAYNMVQGAKTPAQAAQIIDRYYERSSGDTTRQRMQDAEAYYKQFAQSQQAPANSLSYSS